MIWFEKNIYYGSKNFASQIQKLRVYWNMVRDIDNVATVTTLNIEGLRKRYRNKISIR